MSIPLVVVFADVPDPRRGTKNKLHELVDILTLATCAVIAGADGWDQVAAFGRAKQAFFAPYLRLPNGVPSPDTFERVFAKLDLDAFADRFARWVAEVGETTGLTRLDIDGPTHIAVDGTSARRSGKPTFSGGLHRVEAWAVGNRLILGQRSVPDGSHEIPTFRDLLATLHLTGAVVTLDVAGRQTETLGLIRERGVEYVVCAKGNQPTLRDAIAGMFDRAGEAEFVGCDGHTSVTDAHGRHEERNVRVVQNPDGLPASWADVGAVALMCRERAVNGKANASTAHYYVTSLRVGSAGTGGLHPQPLGHRERVPRGAGHRVPEGRLPGSGRTCRGQAGHDPARRPLTPPTGRHHGQHPHSPQEGRPGR